MGSADGPIFVRGASAVGDHREPALAHVVKHTAALADRVRRPEPGVVVLIYHRVGGGSDSEVDLPIEVFAAQLSWLAQHAEVLDLDTAVTRLTATPASQPTVGARPAVVLTFDDGTTDFIDHAVPLLAEHGLPALLYVATRFVDEQTPFPWGAPPATWSGLREAVSTGLVTLGSHTHSHVLLDRTTVGAIDDELTRSHDLLARHTGRIPAHFAYPKAVAPDAAAEARVRARFATAALAGTRRNVAGRTDVHRLWRSPVQRSDGMRFFRAKVHGGLRLEDDLRRFKNRIRYAGATA